MAKRYIELMALLAKLEASYGVDATPTGVANAILAKNCSIEPLLGTDIPRNLMLPYMGNKGVILAGNYARLAFDVEMAGAGAAGDAPAYGALLRMCGQAEGLTEDVDAQYHPISRNFESGDIYYYLDGVRHILLGSRGKVSVNAVKAVDLGHFHFEITGLPGTITDTAIPTLDLDGFQTPEPIGDTLTSLSLHGVTLPVESLSIDWGNQVETRFLINAKGIEITGHPATGSITMEAALLATKDWFQIAKDGTLGALAFHHGSAAGKKVWIDAPTVQIGRPTQGSNQGIANYTLPLSFIPSSTGNDELLITVK